MTDAHEIRAPIAPQRHSFPAPKRAPLPRPALPPLQRHSWRPSPRACWSACALLTLARAAPRAACAARATRAWPFRAGRRRAARGSPLIACSARPPPRPMCSTSCGAPCRRCCRASTRPYSPTARRDRVRGAGGRAAGRAGVACGRTPPRSARACRQDPHAAGRHLRPPAARHCAARGGRAGARHCCLPRALPVQGARGVGRGGALPRCRVRRPALSPHAGHAVSGGDLPRAHQGPAAPRE